MADSQPSLSVDAPQDSPVEYRPVVDFPAYRVGSDGSVWTCRIPGKGSRIGTEWRRLAAVKLNGYHAVGLTRDGKRTLCKVYHLVLEAFVGPCPAGMQGCHFPDPDKSNNTLANLRWDTPSGNNQDKEFQGTHQIGERNPRAKLTASEVVAIRGRAESGESLRGIARDHGVTDTLIRLIVQRKCWKHV